MTAWINGIVGVGLTLVLSHYLGWSVLEGLRACVVSIAAGLVAVLVVLKGERIPKVKRTLLRGGLRTWVVFLSLYLAPQFILLPQLRSWDTWKVLAFPLVMATGFTILIFGPIQDRIVARSQRRQKAKSAQLTS